MGEDSPARHYGLYARNERTVKEVGPFSLGQYARRRWHVQVTSTFC